MSNAASGHDRRFRLDGRTAFLSGAAGHLGRAMAVALGEAGAHVILNGRTQATLDALAAELQGQGIACSVAAFDVMDRGAAAALFGGLERLDILINNAITGMPRKDDITSASAFMATLDSGVAATHDNVRLALPALEAAVAANGDASVINITSIYAHRSPRFSTYGGTSFISPPQYSAAKGALIQLTRYLACELGPKRIRVNSLSPGVFPWDQIVQNEPEFVARSGAQTPLGRTGRADELGGAAVFLAGPAATYVTGADLLVDGGWTAW